MSNCHTLITNQPGGDKVAVDAVAIGNTSSSSLTDLLSDNPCWGSHNLCTLRYLLTLISSTTSILYESPDYIVLNKPPDLRMDGRYPATVYKLLTYWYPPPSLLQQQEQQRISSNNNNNNTEQEEDWCQYVMHHVHQSRDVANFELRHCHQLDYATSGVLLVARHTKAAAMAQTAFQNRMVKKVYLALIHGHVQVNEILTKFRNNGTTTTTTTTTSTTGISQDFLDQYMKRTEQTYRRTKQQKQFQPIGSLPPSSLFLKWKSMMRQQQQQEQKQTTMRSSSPPPYHPKPTKRLRTNHHHHHHHQGLQPQWTDQEWNQIWKHTIDLLTDDDQILLKSLDWKQVKMNDQWKHAFTQASEIHNAKVRTTIMAAAAAASNATTTTTTTTVDTLPTVFQVVPDDNDNDNYYHPIDNPNQFYIYAPTAEVPNQFAVRVPKEARLYLALSDTHNPSSQQDLLSSCTSLPFITTTFSSITSSPRVDTITTPMSDSILPTRTESHNNNNDNDNDETQLDYKPSLTKCTILDHAYGIINGILYPVTKIQLEPKTGRRHQLRVHMAHVLGTPIVQDQTYYYNDVVSFATTLTTNHHHSMDITKHHNPTTIVDSNDAVHDTRSSPRRNTTTTTTSDDANRSTTTTSSTIGSNNSTATNERVRMCLHAHTLEIPLWPSIRSYDSSSCGAGSEPESPQLLTVEAPDPFVIIQDNENCGRKLVHINRL